MVSRRAWLFGLGNLVAVLVLYFAVPVRPTESAATLGLQIALSVLAAGAAIFVIMRETRLFQAGDHARMTGLRAVLILEFVVVVFSLTYYLLAVHATDQIEGLETRLDALYFTVTSMATIGFGDIHATGQLGRAVLTVHVVFNVAFLALVANLIRGRLAQGGFRRDVPDDDR